MRKVLLVPDSFKGNLSSVEVCALMAQAIERHYPHCQVVAIPVADGGEGTVDAFLASLPGHKVTREVAGPYREPLRASYGIIEGGATAVIEMAACAGLPLVGSNRAPHLATTYGVGELIADALKRGCSKIIIGLGGSASNDFGAGAAAALGVRFYGEHSPNPFVPTGSTLHQVTRIDTSSSHPQLAKAKIQLICDINNPLYGQQGAAHIFAPQKGADPEMVQFLDAALRSIHSVVRQQLGQDVAQLPGAGAAGGMGGGMAALFGATLLPGIEVVLDTVGFDQQLNNCDLVLTGEGSFDAQSLGGKVVMGVVRRCQQQGVPVIALVGDITADAKVLAAAYEAGLSAIFSINSRAQSLADAIVNTAQDLALGVDNLMRFLQVMKAK